MAYLLALMNFAFQRQPTYFIATEVICLGTAHFQLRLLTAVAKGILTLSAYLMRAWMAREGA
jgi:hypothetical protein